MGLALLPLCARAADPYGLVETVQRIKPSIVAVGTVQPTRRPPGWFGGTGFVVADGRHVLTNAHVIPPRLDTKHREVLSVWAGASSDKVRRAKVVAMDRRHDVVLLKIDGERLPPMTLGDSDRVREGELYAFTGFPIGMVLGLRPVTHRGIVSAITPIAVPEISARSLNPEIIRRLNAPFDVFQLDATAYPGNSGSPLYDTHSGRVVGILNMVFVKESKEHVLDRPSGISYAIPIRYAHALLEKAGLSVP